MKADVLRKLLNVRPFEPIELELSSGQVWTITLPENVLVTKSMVVVVDSPTDTVQWMFLIHLVAVRRCQSSLPTV